MTLEMSKEYRLIVPVTFEGEERTSVTVRRMKAKDLRKFDVDKTNMDESLKLIGKLIGWPSVGVDELDQVDVEGILAIIEGFQATRHS